MELSEGLPVAPAAAAARREVRLARVRCRCTHCTLDADAESSLCSLMSSSCQCDNRQRTNIFLKRLLGGGLKRTITRLALKGAVKLQDNIGSMFTTQEFKGIFSPIKKKPAQPNPGQPSPAQPSPAQPSPASEQASRQSCLWTGLVVAGAGFKQLRHKANIHFRLAIANI